MLRIDRNTWACFLRNAVQSGDATGKWDMEDAQASLTFQELSQPECGTISDSESPALRRRDAFRILFESAQLIAIPWYRVSPKRAIEKPLQTQVI